MMQVNGHLTPGGVIHLLGISRVNRSLERINKGVILNFNPPTPLVSKSDLSNGVMIMVAGGWVPHCLVVFKQ